MKLNVKPAATGMYHHSYNPLSLATLDFAELVPIKVFECVAKDEINTFHGSGILRLAPQNFPAFGKCFLRTAAFFVPEYQVVEYSEALRNNMNSYKGKPIDFVHIYHNSLTSLFSSHYQTGSNDWVTLVGQASSSSNFPPEPSYDFFEVINNNGTSEYMFYKLTQLGRRYYKILKGCGIDFCSATATGTYSTDLASVTTVINLNCLLSYAKIYCDMFLNSHRYNDDPLVALLHHIHDNDTYTVGGVVYFDSSTSLVDAVAIQLILTSIKVPHIQNMYTTAWNSPNSPTGVNPSTTMDSPNPVGPVSPFNPSYDVTTYNFVTKEVPRFESSSDSNTLQVSHPNPSASQYTAIYGLSGFGLRLFKAFDNFVRRNNLFGNKAVQRTYARFGIKSDDYKSHYVHKLYENSVRIDFSAIMSNSDTASAGAGKNLGAYAGFGICRPEISFNYKCAENGFIIVLAWIQQAPVWFRGTAPFNLRRYAFDYYTPEYDGQACRAIPYLEFTSCKTPVRAACADQSIFGFTDLYDDYRFDRDSILGDFCLDENTTQQFFFGRNLSGERDSRMTLAFKPQSNFVQYFDGLGVGYELDLNNPFQWSSSLADRFYLGIDWDISMMRPIKTKSEALMLNGTGDLDIQLGGHLID